MSIIIFNLIGFFGILSLTYGHYLLSKEIKSKGYIFSGFGSFFIMLSSLLLNSISFAILDFFWIIISIYGYLNTKNKIKENKIINNKINLVTDFFVFSFVVILILNYQYNELSWITLYLYVINYFLYANGNITVKRYLIMYIIGYSLSIYHFIDFKLYSLFMYETIAALISIYQVLKNKNN